jgi:hypothetical protein
MVKRVFLPFKSMIIGKENTIINSIIKDHLDSFYCKEIFHLSAENSIQTFSDKKFKKIEMKHLEQLRNELFHSVYFFDEIEPNEKSFNEGTFVSKIEQMESVLILKIQIISFIIL